MLFTRPDGRKIKSLPPFYKIIPYIMDKRYDAQNFTKRELEYTVIKEYIREKRREGHTMSFMTVLVAAYIRTLAGHPEFNRFIMNKRIYARKETSVSFVTLKNCADGKHEQTTIKVPFTRGETIFEVSDKLEKAIAENRNNSYENSTDKLIDILFLVPSLVSLVVKVIKFMDRHNLITRSIIEASPFHTSMFFSNLGSINMDYIYHHLYDFGTTGVFITLGKKDKRVVPSSKGEHKAFEYISIGVTTDERFCSGSDFVKGFYLLEKYLKNPRLLEQSPEKVVEDVV